MGLKQEFKEFIGRGNVVDLAVAVIMGGAFGKVVSSLVADLLMPPLGYLIGGIKFTELKLALPGILGHEPVTINYGNFLQATFDFLIISVAVFGMVKLVQIVKSKKPSEAAEEIKLLTEIRDLLARR